MYHYVRPIKKSKFSRLKGLELSAFKGQLEYFQKHYHPITMEEVISAVINKTLLPKNALLLTFDDGYLDHFEYVFPLLKKLGWQGSFFPPGITVFENKILDINKIHFILARVDEIDPLIRRLFSLLDSYRGEYKLLSSEEYYRVVAVAGRFDNEKTMFVKRMLQKVLPQPIRSFIVDKLFQEYVTQNSEEFSQQLYLNLEQLRLMRQEGMFIGGHSYAHDFLDTLNPSRQIQEINSSLKLIKMVGAPTENWVICYPYGAYNAPLLQLLKDRKCLLGLTINVGIAYLNLNNPLELPRLDANDFPASKTAPVNTWLKEIL